ncbi:MULTISPECIES: hypothetical protein [Roseivirga]|uniref:Outer membrane protein beta-barrel domain-containing protein n=1 Tax=Roseivirga thermotolerans TaxID=1758176 RepID=A0ABQ3I5F3_9BACT|nr:MULTISPECIES: hypothetical protein [Roseivirga]MEC7754434.1 hypothetical protein [Bacteroidota bacterium]GHE57564.1 hypothetical protein GCM10011340_10770 [Roseivirga thermotolerans]|tara:strand:- start:15123 stop:15692 length:570 start_codon:yes stop_codon:yes gene_type:complete
MKKSTLTILGIAVMIMALVSTTNKLNAATDPQPEDSVIYRDPMLQVANNYGINALGIRAVGTTGLTYKHFNAKGNAFEAILGFGNNSFSITGLAEKYAAPFDSDYLELYYGFGGHAVFQSDSNLGVDRNRFDDADDAFGLGVDFILGLELMIPQTPLALSLDIKPFFEVATTGNAYFGIDPGFGVKVFF